MSSGHGIRKRESAAMVASGSCGLAFAVQPPPFGCRSLAAAVWPPLFSRCRLAVAVWPSLFGRRCLAVPPFGRAGLGFAAQLPQAARAAMGFLAPGLIAAKLLKPCDGAVFWALDLLLKNERRARNSQARKRRDGCVWLLRFGLCGSTAAVWPLLFGRCSLAAAVQPSLFGRAAVWPRWLGLCGAASASRAGCDGLFALGLIAEKPVKPCDGAVFGALDRLLKTERNTLHGSRVWLALLRLRLFQGAGSRAAWHFGQAGSRMRAALFAARAASLCRWRFSFHGAAFFMLLPTSFAMPHSLTGAAPLPR